MLALFFIGSIICIALDQFTKYLVLDALSLDFCKVASSESHNAIEVIKDVLDFRYIGNSGGAFGIFSDSVMGRIFLILFTIIVIAAVIYFMIKKKPKSKLLITSLTLLVGGALGNFIDRIFRGFVIDFIQIKFIDFPIFNVADCFVVVGAILLALYILFFSPDFPKSDKNKEKKQENDISEENAETE